MSEISHLIARYVEDRDGLSEGELDQLILELRTQPQLAVVVRGQLTLDDLLSQKVALDRRNFLAQVGQRVADFEQGEEEVFNQVAEMRAMAEVEFQQVAHPQAPRRGWYAVLALAAAALLAAYVAPRFLASAGPLAQLAAVTGEAVLTRPGGSSFAQGGGELRAGDTIDVRSGRVELTYPDGTQVYLAAGASAVLVAGDAQRAKEIRLDRGELAASVTPQTTGPMQFLTPHAVAVVRGTQLRLVVDDNRTQLEVSEGKVELAHRRGGQPLLVAAQQSGVADADQLALRDLDWPDHREAALFIFRSADEIGLARNPETGNLRHTPLHAHGAVFASAQHTLVLAGGGYLSQEAGEDLAPWVRQEPRFSLELVFFADRPRTAAAAAIVAWGQPGAENLLIQQEGDALVLLADVAADEPSLRLPLGAVHADQATHLLVSLGEEGLAAFVNGEEVARREMQAERLTHWSPGPLRFGPARDAAAPSAACWRGVICGLAAYHRTFDAPQAAHSFRRYQEVYAPRNRGHEWNNRLAEVDLSQFAGGGGWQLQEGAWVNRREDGAWLTLLPEAAPQYELLLDLVPPATASVRLVLPVGDGWAALRLAGGKARLETLSGPPIPVGDPPGDCTWNAGAANRLEVAVRAAGESGAVSATLNGQPLVRWNGPLSALAAGKSQPHADAPYVEIPRGALRIETLKVRP